MAQSQDLNEIESAESEVDGTESANSVSDEVSPAVDSMTEPGEQKPAEDVSPERLEFVGLVGVTFLMLLAVLFGYLRLDHATRGFYSGKLQTVAVILTAAILATSFYIYVQLFGF